MDAMKVALALALALAASGCAGAPPRAPAAAEIRVHVVSPSGELERDARVWVAVRLPAPEGGAPLERRVLQHAPAQVVAVDVAAGIASKLERATGLGELPRVALGPREVAIRLPEGVEVVSAVVETRTEDGWREGADDLVVYASSSRSSDAELMQ